MKAIILAGGGGTRLWPLSRESFPKQFLSLGSNLSLLQKTIARLEKVSFIDSILIATNEKYQDLVLMQIEQMNSQKAKVFLEPERKNTAPAIALALKYLQEFEQLNNDPVLVLPSDHLIEPEIAFMQSVEKSIATAQQDRIITFGIQPTKPETGYGYIEISKPLDGICYSVERFIEKPPLSKAIEYLQNSSFLWNSGMFLFLPSTFFSEIEKLCPELANLTQKTYAQFAAEFSSAPDISIDYALLEKTKKIACKPLQVSWSDIGSWDSLYEVLEKDSNQNVKIGSIIDQDTKNCLIFGSKRLIATVSVENLLIIDTEDALFLAEKGKSQQVKELVAKLKESKREERLSHPLKLHSFGSLKTLEKSSNYHLQKLQILPNQKFLIPASKNSEKILVLQGQITLKGESFSSSDSIELSNEDIFLENFFEEPAELLWVSNAPNLETISS